MTKIVRMPYEGKDVPHLVIEVNQQCNISCKACYKDKYGMTKDLNVIKHEVDLALSKRNLSVITLAGGEPTLHPKLSEIISYISSKGVLVQMLSNGYGLTKEMLLTFKEAGLKEIFLHIDKHQTRNDFPQTIDSEMDLNYLRNRIGALIKACGITASLEITLYKSTLVDLDRFLNYVLSSSLFTRLLVTCCTDFSSIIQNYKTATVLNIKYHNSQQKEDHTNQLNQEVFDPEIEIVDRLKKQLSMEPFGYVASNDSDDEKRWIFYYSFSIINSNNDVKLLHLKKDFGNLVRLSNWYAEISETPLSFGRILDQRGCVILLVIYAITSLNPISFFKTFYFLSYLLIPKTKIYHKSFTFQLKGPTVNQDGTIEYCKDCPDATIREGELVPVCMADILKPLK